VRELFGGPRGCTHVTALLQAMAPVAIQCGWSMRVVTARSTPPEERQEFTGPMREMALAMNLNTCHVWDEDGVWVEMIRKDTAFPPPLNVRKRLSALGRPIEDWERLRA
jgi:hypothetical protein